MGRILEILGISNKGRLKNKGVKSFKENQNMEAAFDACDRGRCQVPLDQIVGSVGRYKDFDNQFKPRQHVPPERLKIIKDLIKQGKPLPPVKLYQIKEQYFVLDGNHRIAAAKEFGWISIDAHILQRHVFEGILNITDPTDKRLKYVGGDKGVKYLMEQVDAGHYQAAFAMANAALWKAR